MRRVDTFDGGLEMLPNSLINEGRISFSLFAIRRMRVRCLRRADCVRESACRLEGPRRSWSCLPQPGCCAPRRRRRSFQRCISVSVCLNTCFDFKYTYSSIQESDPQYNSYCDDKSCTKGVTRRATNPWYTARILSEGYTLP